MKRTHRLTAVLLAFCLAATTLSTGVTAGAAETGTTHTVTSDTEFNTALTTANDGDTIQISGSVTVSLNGSNANSDIPLIISKKLTIQGGKLSLRTGGIALNNDVTFRDIDIDFPNPVRNAILANGHILTLENVTSNESAHEINLFCGGYAGRSSGTEDFNPNLLNPGTDGTIIIKGSTNLQGKTNLANIYAGNLCLGSMNVNTSDEDGRPNEFAGTATIQIDGNMNSNVGKIYACGAQ